MRYIKTFEGIFFPKRKSIVKQDEEIPYSPRDYDAETTFTDHDIQDIKDMFLDVSDEYRLEEDPNGKILDYMNFHIPSRRGRDNPQFFTEKIGDKLLTFSVASSSSFITEQFKLDLQEFKDRLGRAGYECGVNDILYTPWIKYVSFYINKPIK